MERGANWRPEVVAFADLMEARLREHDERRAGNSWPAVPYAMDLVAGATRNVGELGVKVARWESPELGEKIDALAIMRQAADVANFAMMVADRCGPLPMAPRDPWWPVDAGFKNGKLCWVLVDYRETTSAAHPLEDALVAATLGFNTFSDTGEDAWHLVGWCWQHDHFTNGKGAVIACKPIGFDLTPPACFVPIAAEPKA